MVEINDDPRGKYKTGNQFNYKTLTLKPILCDYNNAYVLIKGTVSVATVAASGRNNNKEVIFKNCVQEGNADATMFLIIEEAKESKLFCLNGTVKVL